MKEQLGLFIGGGSDESREARDQGIASVTDNNLSWHDDALARLNKLVGSKLEMTGEEMRIFLLKTGLESPTRSYAWGALIRHAVTSGLIVDTGKVKQMTIVKSHARRTPVWLFI